MKRSTGREAQKEDRQMTSYYISEQENRFSSRARTKIEAKTLAEAKRMASRARVFRGTCLCVWDADGSLIAFREPGVGWCAGLASVNY